MLDHSISIDPLLDGQVIALLEKHRQSMFSFSPAESIHALEEQALKKPDVKVWSVRDAKNEAVLGCIALKQLYSDHSLGEVKSMKVEEQFLGLGLGKALLEVLLSHATTEGYQALALETGSHPFFDPARRLYERYGFVETGPFASYSLDPHSVFYELKLV